MENNDWIAYVGPFLFPNGQAGSRRVEGVASSLGSAGYQVVVGSGEQSPEIKTNLRTFGEQGNLSFIGLGELPSDSASKLSQYYRWFCTLGERTIRWLSSQRIKPSYVILYHGYTPFVIRLLKWCRKNQVPLIADVVEWYDARHLPGGLLGPMNLNTKTALKILYPKCDGIIAISSLLGNYYTNCRP